MERKGWFKIHVGYGELMPSWYGFAYREPHRRGAICYPVPLNLIVGLWLQVIDRVRIGFADKKTESELRCMRCYLEGRNDEKKIYHQEIKRLEEKVNDTIRRRA